MDDDDGGGRGAAAAAPDRALYARLGVRPDASDEDVRRAFRAAAATLHPDKVRDEALRPAAAAAFAELQEAYEVLGDPAKRDVYDVYGPEGLAAGMALADPGRPREALRREWEEFRARGRRERVEAAANYRGHYRFALDATAAVNPYDAALPRTPAISSIYMTSGVDVPVGAGAEGAAPPDVLHLGGLVQVRGDASSGEGGGAFLAGYRRLSPSGASLEIHAAAGLKSLLTITHSAPLSPAARGAIVGSWSPAAGPGLQLLTTRQLSDAASGELAWTVGPRAAAGLALSLTRRGAASLAAARLDVSAAGAPGLALRLQRRLGGEAGATTARASVRLGVGFIEGEVGAVQRLSDFTSAGLGVAAGPGGVSWRLRYVRAGHVFEFPILLAPEFDPGVLAVALALPPLALGALGGLLVRPLLRAAARRRAAAARAAQAAEISAAVGAAAAAAALMAPVAARRVRREAAARGLVVALALYGEEGAVRAASRARLAAAAAPPPPVAPPPPAEPAPATEEAAAPPAPPRAAGVRAHPLPDVAPAAEPAAPAEPAAEAAEPLASTADSAAAEAAAAEAGLPPLPPPLLDVTTALRYMTEAGGRVNLHGGYPMSGLLGFADPAPGAPKMLLVYYTHKGRPMVARVADGAGAALPAAGAAVADRAEAEAVVAAAARAAA